MSYGKHDGYVKSLKEDTARWVMSLPEMRAVMLEAAKSMDPVTSFDGESLGMEAVGRWLVGHNGLIDRAQATCMSNSFLAFAEPEYDMYWRRQAFIEAGRYIRSTAWWKKNSIKFRRAVRNRKLLEEVMDD